ncbi:MAG: hypothetical protein ACREH5_01560, partial [Candidatus Omnitrophota bacterium]
EIASGERRADRSLSALDKDLARPKKTKEGVRAALINAIDPKRADEIPTVTLKPEEIVVLKRFSGSIEKNFGDLIGEVLKDQGVQDLEIEKKKKQVIADLEKAVSGARLTVQKLTKDNFDTNLQKQMEALMGEKMSDAQQDAVVKTLSRPDNASLLYYSKEGKLLGFVIASAKAAVTVQGEFKTGAVIVLEGYEKRTEDTVRSVLLNQVYQQAGAADVYKEDAETGEVTPIGKAETLWDKGLSDLLEEAEEGADVVAFMSEQSLGRVRFMERVRAFLENAKQGKTMTAEDIATRSELQNALLDHDPLAALRHGVKAGDRIVVFNYRNLKGNNKKLGYFGNNRVIAAMREVQLELMREQGLIAEGQGALARNAKLHKLVVKGELRLTDDKLAGKLVAVSDAFRGRMKERFPNDDVFLDIGFSKPVEKETDESDDKKLAADLEALQAAKIARLGYERDILDTSVSGFNDTQFETIVQNGRKLGGKLGLNGIQGASDEAVMETREKREGDLPEYIKYHVDLFDNPKPQLYSDADFNRRRRDEVLGILQTLNKVSLGRAPPADLAKAIQDALKILQTSRKDSSFINGPDFPAAIVNSKGFIIVADKSNFYALAMKKADEAFQKYLKDSPGFSDAEKKKLLLRLVMEADDRVKEAMAKSRAGLIKALDRAGAKVRFGNIEGGDEIILFAEEISEKGLEALRGSFGGLGLRIVIKEYNGKGDHKELAEVLNRAATELDGQLRAKMATGSRAFVVERRNPQTGRSDILFYDFTPVTSVTPAGARLTPATRLDAAGFSRISTGFSPDESASIIESLAEDNKSGYSQVAGSAFVVAAPAKVKIGSQEVARPVIRSVKINERQRKRGAHAALFLASAEAMNSKNMPNSFWEIAVTDTPEVRNQLEIAKSLGYL